jgi:hypothetical protein
VVASSTTGRVLHRYPAPRAVSAWTAGWLGPGDLLFPTGYAVPRGWRTTGGAVTAEPASPVAVSEARGLVAGVLGRTRGSQALCLAVWDVDHPQGVRWDGCLQREGRVYTVGVESRGAFSPDGRFLATVGRQDRGPSRPFMLVTDSLTGEVVARLDEGRDDGSSRGPEYVVNELRWEDDTHLLLVVDDRTLAILGPAHDIEPLEAIVRCDVTVPSCELATTPRRTAPMETSPYGLVG